MTLLRQRMTEDMQLRGLAPATQQAYLRYVEQLALFTGKSPDLVTDEEFRQFFLALHKQPGLSRSTLLAVQERLTLDYSEEPITALVVIDVRREREATVDRVTKAFVVPIAFEGSSIVYRIDRAGEEGTEHFKVDATMIEKSKELG
jgi:integrase-like protein